MEEHSVERVMWILAVATPVVGLLLWLVGRMTADSGEGMTIPGLKLKALILAAAGPLNLLVWWLFNGWLDSVGYRSVIGYAGAAVVFVLAGVLTGWFSRRRGRGDAGPSDPDEKPETAAE